MPVVTVLKITLQIGAQALKLLKNMATVLIEERKVQVGNRWRNGGKRERKNSFFLSVWHSGSE